MAPAVRLARCAWRALHAWHLRRWLRASERERLYWQREREFEAPRREAAATIQCRILRAKLAMLGALQMDE